MMDSVVTPELRLEGIARDLIRMIQDMRKEAGYEVTDRIQVSLQGESALSLAPFVGMIREETLADTIVYTSLEIPDMTRSLDIDTGNTLKISIQRV